MIDGTDKAMATGTERKRRTSIIPMHQAPPMAAVGLVKRPMRQTATSPKPMVSASAPGRSRREPLGKSFVVFGGWAPVMFARLESAGGGGVPVRSVFAFIVPHLPC